MISFQEALDQVQANKIVLVKETIKTEDALNRILAEDIFADRDYPPFDRAAMDGFAVNTEWYNALDRKTMPNQGVLFAGKEYTKQVDKTRSLRIMTGAAVPEGLDAIIKVEDAQIDCDMVFLDGPSKMKSGLNIAQKGEDLKQGNLVLKKGTVLSPQNLQALATIGKVKVIVETKPKIALITTGDEVVDLGLIPNDFQIRNSNLWSIRATLENLGFSLTFQKHVEDDSDKIKTTINEALQSSDILILTGGVSMGEADFVPRCLEENGVSKVFHKVAIKPGKPIWFGKSENKVVFGLPGNPLSAFLDLHLFVLTFFNAKPIKLIKSILVTEQKESPIDRWIPFYMEDGLVKTKNFNGSGDVTALINSDGFVLLEKNKKYIFGDRVDILLF